MNTGTTHDAPLMAFGRTTLVRLAAAAVLAAAGCTGSEPVEGIGGAPGRGGTVGSSGATASGSGPTETGGSGGTGGNGASAGNVAVGGTTGGLVGSGGSSAGGRGSGGSGGGSAGVAGATASGNGPTETGGSATGGIGASAGNAATGGTTGGQVGSGGSSAGGRGSGGSGGSKAGMGGAAGRGGGGGGAAASACLPARAHAMGSSTVNVQSSGKNRSYLLHVPPGYDGIKPLPLVFDVHGYTSFASEQLMRSKWDQLADKEAFVLIDPEGINKSWNAGSCCGGNSENDVKFFRDMVAKATAELCIDTKRVYVSGHSNGGAMTYRLACEAADIFAAVAPVCGWMTVSTCSPARPIPVLAIRGLNDGTVRIDGADADIDKWLSNDKCANDQVTTSGVCKTYKSCEGGTQVMDCRPRGDHDFFYGSNPDKYLVPDNAWPFFKQFSLP